MWHYALINNRIAEIFRNDDGSSFGHCYVTFSELQTKTEKKWAKEDTVVHDFSYRNGKYRNKFTGKIVLLKSLPRITKKELAEMKSYSNILDFKKSLK